MRQTAQTGWSITDFDLPRVAQARNISRKIPRYVHVESVTFELL